MKKHGICIDFGGTEVKVGLFLENKLLETHAYHARVEVAFEDVLFEAKAFIETVLFSHGLIWQDLMGIGIAMPGIVHFHNKKLISINEKYDSAIGFDIEGWVRQHLDLPVILENDANAALLGEKMIGTIGDAKYAALMIFGTGVGTAVIIEDKLFRGAHYQGGCLGGHMIVDYKGRACNCGSIGCLEAQASTWALPEIAKLRPEYHMSCLKEIKQPKLKDLVVQAESGDAFSKKLLQEFIEKWSAGIINLIHAYDPEVIVLSGGILQAGEVITKPLIERVKTFAWMPNHQVEIVVSHHLKESVLYGMQSLIMTELQGEN